MAKKKSFQKNPPTDFKDVNSIKKPKAEKGIQALREALEYRAYLYYIKK